MSFYPDTYAPRDDVSDYMKLPEGEHKIRILRQPIMGYEGWKDDGKPMRAKTMQELINLPLRDIKEFHAFIVWDYEVEMVRLLNITQKTIQKWIYNQTTDEDWADPTQYDIVITRTGKTKEDTEYLCTAKLPKPMSKEIKEAYAAISVNDEAYYNDGHPIVRSNENAAVQKTTDQLSDEDVNTITNDIPF